MVRVFISHSQHDDDIKNFFSNIFTHIGLQAKYMEWEDLDRKYAGVEIMQYICSYETVAVLLLLGRNLQFPPALTRRYTHNWVIFEAGLAAGAGKPIWVFEAVNDNIKFPVPLVTDYAQYILDDTSSLRNFGQLFRQQFMYQYDSSYPPYRPRIERCPYETCNATYRFWSNSQVWHCPVCRRRIPRSADSDTDGFFPITIA
jgi:hypothetical protein